MNRIVQILIFCYDIEGMEEAARKHSLLTRRMAEEVGEDSFVRILHTRLPGDLERNVSFPLCLPGASSRV